MIVDPRTVPIRYSNLKHIGRSPAHYIHAINHPREDSGPLRIGRLVHWHILGAMPDDEDGEIHVYDGDRRGKAWESFAAEHTGSEIVTAKEWAKAAPIADAVRNNAFAMSLIEGALCEQPIAWKIGSRACSSRPDAFKHYGALVDLKTTNDASIVALQRMAQKMAYHAQAAMYRDALASIGVKTTESLIIAVETKAPYPVTVMRLTERRVDEGRRLYRSWYETLRTCEDSDHWPAYTESVVSWDVSEWEEADGPNDPEDAEEEEAAA